MSIDFTFRGEEGKQCKICTHFRKENINNGTGTCFGKEVNEGGSCKFFRKKLI